MISKQFLFDNIPYSTLNLVFIFNVFFFILIFCVSLYNFFKFFKINLRYFYLTLFFHFLLFTIFAPALFNFLSNFFFFKSSLGYYQLVFTYTNFVWVFYFCTTTYFLLFEYSSFKKTRIFKECFVHFKKLDFFFKFFFLISCICF